MDFAALARRFVESSLSILRSHREKWKDLYFVSVGCGLAQMEFVFCKTFDIPPSKLFLVDPDPTSSTHGCLRQMLPVSHKYVDDLLSERPDVKGACILMLWNLDPGYSLYDMEAIRKLDPRAILVSYDVNFSSGGYLMHAWLQRNFPSLGFNEPVTEKEIKRPERWFPASRYGVLSHDTWCVKDDGHGEAMFRVALLEKRRGDDTRPSEKTMYDPDFATFARENAENIAVQKLLEQVLSAARAGIPPETSAPAPSDARLPRPSAEDVFRLARTS